MPKFLRSKSILTALSILITAAISINLYLDRQENPNYAYLNQLAADFSSIRHPAGSTLIDNFSGFGNFSTHRQIFDARGDFCDFWVVELHSYTGTAQEVYAFYQSVQLEPSWPHGLDISLLFVRTNYSKTFEQTHLEMPTESYGDTFALDFFINEYLWRFPPGLDSSQENLYFIYFLETNVTVSHKYRCS